MNYPTILLATICLLLSRSVAYSQERTASNNEAFSYITLKDEGVRFLVENEASKVQLNANNCFFDKGCFRAMGQQQSPAHEKKLISAHFSALVAKKHGTIRWHLWISKPGKITLSPQFDELSDDQWSLSLAKQEKSIKRTNLPLTYTIPKAGRYICELRYKGTDTASKKIKGIQVSGAVAASTAVIRTRWRPSAIHAQFSSSTCPKTKLWVFETQSKCKHSHYSPMTTAFGYYGATFNAKGNAAGGMNFSMWAASAKSKQAPSLEKTPHLLASSNKDAEFGGFGHEGSGVKIRNWSPFAHHPKSVIQALRLEIKNGFNVYYGYFYDERENKWKLFAMGRQPVRRRNPITSLRATSFCEVPGPPAVERTGDQVRLIRRRGWFLDEDKRWHPVDTIKTRIKGATFSNKFIVGGENNWLHMGTGGILESQTQRSVTNTNTSHELPVYLEKSKAAQLYQLPADIGNSKIENLTSNSSTIHYAVQGIDEKKTEAVLYYGTTDCFSFRKRKLHGTERKGVSKKMLHKDRTWQNATKAVSPKAGTATFQLKDLRPKTTYYYRLYVSSDNGQIWSDQPRWFTTP